MYKIILENCKNGKLPLINKVGVQLVTELQFPEFIEGSKWSCAPTV
jgi:hypothetical protein